MKGQPVKTKFHLGESEAVGICTIKKWDSGYRLYANGRLVDNFKTLEYARQSAQKICNYARECDLATK